MGKKLLEDCKKCKLHDGMEGTFVKCGRVKQFTVMVPTAGEDSDRHVLDCEQDGLLGL
jgi:hypothetical protein